MAWYVLRSPVVNFRSGDSLGDLERGMNSADVFMDVAVSLFFSIGLDILFLVRE